MAARSRYRLSASLLGALLAAAIAAAGASPRGLASAAPGFLTGPSSSLPVAIVTGYLRQHLADYGLQPGDVAEAVATKVVTGSDSGVTYVYLQQRHGGIDVQSAIANGAVMRDGRLL